MATRQIPFTVALREPVLGVTARAGWLIEGDAGWAEWSPLPSWSREENAAVPGSAGGRRPALPGAGGQLRGGQHHDPAYSPPARRPDGGGLGLRHREGQGRRPRRGGSGCGRCGRRSALLSGSGSTPTARRALDEAAAALARLAVWEIELVDDPVADLRDLAVLRRRSPVPVAAEMAIRCLEDVVELRRLDAADAPVLKPQRIGGIAAALRAAELAAGVPVVVSSALETSVGLASCLAVAAALPGSRYAHGVGTAPLLAEDVTANPLRPLGGRLVPRRVEPDLLLVRRP